MLNTCYKQGMKMLLFFLLCLVLGAVSPSKEQEVKLQEVKLQEVKEQEVKEQEVKLQEVKLQEVKLQEVKLQEVKLLRGGCPMFWYNFNDRCYKYVAARMNWANAELHCLSQGANLVSIHSQNEENFVKSLIKNFDHFEGETWIGLTDAQQDGSWFWSDGSKLSFNNWNSGEPNGWWKEACVHTNRGTPKNWNDVPCSVEYAFVCKTRMLNTCYKQGMKMLLFFLLCLVLGAVSPSKEQEVKLQEVKKQEVKLQEVKLQEVKEHEVKLQEVKEQEVKLLRGGCPMFWYNFNDRCYKYVATRMNWANAELHCLSQGANLVSIHSQNEENFVKSLIKNFDHFEGETWIGLTDAQQDGSWFWSDGSKLSFSNWNSGEPNGWWKETCVNTNWDTPKNWNDISCSGEYAFVCKTCPL
ncbi:lymphocyte antigen 75-like [Cololabis saira]|uniref:lymphocyte antigen 75-like n=1 Tax=Cololabis saira TaxID=129043 RepID=UPI002AD22029|nr:lymphocyte antigen 75-like [Cololabis saira]